MGLEQMLEFPDRAPFYDLLGGLPDNLITLGTPRPKRDHYHANENWSVAEFLTQILRLRTEDFLGAWFHQLGIRIERRHRFFLDKKQTVSPSAASAATDLGQKRWNRVEFPVYRLTFFTSVDRLNNSAGPMYSI